MLNKHLTGLDGDLKKGIRYNEKHGGVTDTLKKLKKRPDSLESHNYRLNALYNSQVFNKCDKCENQAEYSSSVNGISEYRLCRRCYGERLEPVLKVCNKK